MTGTPGQSLPRPPPLHLVLSVPGTDAQVHSQPLGVPANERLRGQSKDHGDRASGTSDFTTSILSNRLHDS